MGWGRCVRKNNIYVVDKKLLDSDKQFHINFLSDAIIIYCPASIKAHTVYFSSTLSFDNLIPTHYYYILVCSTLKDHGLINNLDRVQRLKLTFIGVLDAILHQSTASSDSFFK